MGKHSRVRLYHWKARESTLAAVREDTTHGDGRNGIRLNCVTPLSPLIVHTEEQQCFSSFYIPLTYFLGRRILIFMKAVEEFT